MVAQLSANRLALRATVAVLVTLPLLVGGWLWLRDSSLVAIRHVHIEGVHGPDAIEIRTALDDAATRMTTMDLNVGSLRSAVASYAVVGGLRVTTSFPHTVRIAVSERPPVAALLADGQRTAVAADGTVLGPALLSSSLPTVGTSTEPLPGAKVKESAALAALTVLGAAQGSLARFVVRVFDSSEGLTVAMRNGLLVYFGDSTRPHAKWSSLTRVLASPTAAGALYVDVRLPERPAAGFSSASSSSASSTSASTPVQTGASDPTAAALAASLANTVGGSSTASSGSSTSSSSSESALSSGGAGSSSATSGEESSAASSVGSAPGSSAASSAASTPATGETSSGASAGG